MTVSIGNRIQEKSAKFHLLQPPNVMARDEEWQQFFMKIRDEEDYIDLQYLNSYVARFRMLGVMANNQHSYRYRQMINSKSVGNYKQRMDKLRREADSEDENKKTDTKNDNNNNEDRHVKGEGV